MKNLLQEGMGGYVQPTGLSKKMTIGGETKAFPVYRVRLDQLYYNDQNDRIATWISQYSYQHGSNGLALLHSDEYNDVIEGFIIQSNPTSIEKTQTNIELIGQREAGVILADGRIIDGNRRFTCLRRLSQKDEKFRWFETVILDSSMENNRKQIKMLELAIQHGEEKKVDYNPLERIVGVYQDVVESGMLTVEEYAQSTNESIYEVRKRIGQAELLVDFLEYIHMPKQYHVARDYQIVSILSDLQDFLKKISDAEKKAVRDAVYTNIMMKAIGDGRKYIHNLNTMYKNGTLSVYLREQQRLGGQIQEKLEVASTGTKRELEHFVRDNEELVEELQLSTDKQLLKAKRTETRSKPSQIVTKSITMLRGVDTRIFEKLNDTERDKLRTEVGKLSQMLGKIDMGLGEDPLKEIMESEHMNVQKNTHVQNPVAYAIAPIPNGMPILICRDFGKKITNLSFSLCFAACSDVPLEKIGNYRVFFLDKKQRRICETMDLSIAANEEKKVHFLLDNAISSETFCYLAIQGADDADNQLQQMLTFEIDMLFSADICF